jgi:hypothetical protein
LKQAAQECKSQLLSQIKNQLNNSQTNLNMNCNINQNFVQNFAIKVNSNDKENQNYQNRIPKMNMSNKNYNNSSNINSPYNMNNNNYNYNNNNNFINNSPFPFTNTTTNNIYKNMNFSPLNQHLISTNKNNNNNNNNFNSSDLYFELDNMTLDSSPNSNGNLNINSHPYNPPKRINSSGNLEYSSKKEPLKSKSSFFISNNTNNETEKGEDFKSLNHLFENLTINFWDFAKTQKGSRSLQKLLNHVEPEEINQMINISKDHFKELMTNVYGNYFCQKLIQSCSADQRISVLKNVN